MDKGNVIALENRETIADSLAEIQRTRASELISQSVAVGGGPSQVTGTETSFRAADTKAGRTTQWMSCTKEVGGSVSLSRR